MVHKKNNLLNDTNKEKFKNDALIILKALDDGNLSLSYDEEKKLRKDIKIIFDLIDNSSEDDLNIDLDSIFSNDLNQTYFKDLADDTDADDGLVVDSAGDVAADDKLVVDSAGDVAADDKLVVDSAGDVAVDEDLIVDDVVFDDVAADDVVFDEDLVVDSTDGVAVDDGLIVDDVDVDDGLVVDSAGDVSAGAVEDGNVDDAVGSLIDDYSNDVAIRVKNLSMEFHVSQDKIDTLKEFVIRTIKQNKSESKSIVALKDVSFDIKKGERVGIIGFNGAGKSTLLKLLAQVYYPTGGTIETKGKIAPLLELGAGFDPNYTGKSNIFLNGAFLGYSEKFIESKYDEIVEFSELGEAINYHVKTYSSGMRAKLGFSIATIVEPDILIIDEILSVGDIKFKRKSADKIRSLINSGVTVLLVSHSVTQIRDLCNKAIWIDDGELKMMGDVDKVCDAYVEASRNATKEQLENIEL